MSEAGKIRIGTSYDVHRLKKGEFLLLGGVRIPYAFTEDARSDGDVLFHAVAEAIFGALAIGDLGTYFPSSDPATENMDSALIVEFALKKMKENGYIIGNVDSSLILEEPHIHPYIQKIRENLASVLKTDISNVSVKAGTNEGLDAIGAGKGVGAFASVLLVKEH